MRRIWIAIAIVLAAAATTAIAPAAAHADVNYTCVSAADEPDYKGWATLDYRGCLRPGAPVTRDCKFLAAWRWNGTWSRVTLSECQGDHQVYAYPYAAGWTWIWSQRHGWLAIGSSAVRIRAYTYPSCPRCL